MEALEKEASGLKAHSGSATEPASMAGGPFLTDEAQFPYFTVGETEAQKDTTKV